MSTTIAQIYGFLRPTTLTILLTTLIIPPTTLIIPLTTLTIPGRAWVKGDRSVDYLDGNEAATLALLARLPSAAERAAVAGQA